MILPLQAAAHREMESYKVGRPRALLGRCHTCSCYTSDDSVTDDQTLLRAGIRQSMHEMATVHSLVQAYLDCYEMEYYNSADPPQKWLPETNQQMSIKHETMPPPDQQPPARSSASEFTA